LLDAIQRDEKRGLSPRLFEVSRHRRNNLDQYKSPYVFCLIGLVPDCDNHRIGMTECEAKRRMEFSASFSRVFRHTVKTLPMRTFTTTLLVLAAVSLCQAQVRVPERALPPIRGHYKQLAAVSKSANGKNPVDTLKFPLDRPKAERRLSLTPVYLKTTSLESFVLPDPPANSSKQTRTEINYLLSLQRLRTTEDVRASLHMAKVYYNNRIQPGDTAYARYRRNLFQIGRSMATWFHPDSLPVTANVMANVWRDASYFIWQLKYKYARVRPVTLDPRVKNLEYTDWEAYPSGHAANSYVNAFLYSELAPEFTDFFIKDAYDMAHSREIIGVHYPSDSEASRIFARQLVNMLFKNEKFLKDFEDVRKEWEAKTNRKL